MTGEEIEALLKRDALHYMLQAAFVEIRASKTIHAARKFADVFHNLPMRLLGCSTAQDYDAELEELLARAARWDMDKYVRELSVVATNSVSRKRPA